MALTGQFTLPAALAAEEERRRASMLASPALPAVPTPAQAAPGAPQADPNYWKANLAMGLAGRAAELLGGSAGPKPISLPPGAMLGMEGLRTLYGIQRGERDAQTAWQMHQQQREDAARREATVNAREDRDFGFRQQARNDDVAWRGYEAQNRNAWSTAEWNRNNLFHGDQMDLAQSEQQANKDYRKESLMQGWEGLKLEKEKLAKYLASGGSGGGASGGSLSGAKLDAIASYMQSQGYTDDQINGVIGPMIEQSIGVKLPAKPQAPKEEVAETANEAVASRDWRDWMGLAHDLPLTQSPDGKQLIDRTKLVKGRKYQTQGGIATFDGQDLWLEGMK
jgi:hypothetical protein